MADPIDVGLLPMSSKESEAFTRFVHTIGRDAEPVMAAATGRVWRFHVAPVVFQAKAEARRPSEFLDEASLHMVEGPYDVVIVITDQAVVGRRSVVAGLASAVARIGVMSAWKLQVGPRGEPQQPLDAEAVRWNAATLLVHLLGHTFDVRGDAGAMAPWRFIPERRAVPPIGERAARRMRRCLQRVPEPMADTTNALGLFWFHIKSAIRHASTTWRPVMRSRAPLLPLSMPKLATAALLPVLVLVFTAEIWDVGLNMTNRTAFGLAFVAVLVAAGYVLFVTDILFPRQERRRMSEHLAAVNVAVAVSLLLAMLGLLVMLWLLVMAIALLVFPEGLIRTWPTLEVPSVRTLDKMRLALFVATIGTLTGALGAGLESSTVMRHLALFRKEV